MKSFKKFINESSKTLSKKDIIKALKYDDSVGIMGWIGEFTGAKSDNNNLGGFVTLKMVQQLENEGIIKYIPYENFWASPKEYKKASKFK